MARYSHDNRKTSMYSDIRPTRMFSVAGVECAQELRNTGSEAEKHSAARHVVDIGGGVGCLEGAAAERRGETGSKGGALGGGRRDAQESEWVAVDLVASRPNEIRLAPRGALCRPRS